MTLGILKTPMVLLKNIVLNLTILELFTLATQAIPITTGHLGQTVTERTTFVCLKS